MAFYIYTTYSVEALTVSCFVQCPTAAIVTAKPDGTYNQPSDASKIFILPAWSSDADVYIFRAASRHKRSHTET